jgi:iron complex outermembrane recepter protein
MDRLMAFVVFPVPPFSADERNYFCHLLLFFGKAKQISLFRNCFLKLFKMSTLNYTIKTLLLTSINFFVFIGTLWSQVSFQVYDSKSGSPLHGAAIEIPSSNEIFTTDNRGTAVIDVNPPFNASVSFLGYVNRMVAVTGDRTIFTVYMEPEERMLDEVVVTGYEDNRRLIDIPGAVHRLRPEDVSRFDQTSLVRAMNILPGVRMEERSPGSYRISIRGSSLRSPFDVRNVKIYWNGIPFTDPNGITPLNLLDMNQMQRVEVVKGPAASIYGAGMGGVINLNTERADYGQRSLSASTVMGSYNLRRYTLNFENGSENSNYRFIFSRQASDGYREHTEFDRNTFQLFGEIYSSDRHTLSGNVFYSDLFYQVPGGLTPEQYEADRRQPRPGTPFVPGTREQNASVDYQAFLTSIKSHYVWSDNFENTTAIYGMQSFFKMPFLLDFERETRLGMGGRTSFRLGTNLGQMPLEFLAGGEYQQMFLEGRSFDNDGGRPDTLRFDDEVMARQGMAFLKADLQLSPSFHFTAGMSLNLLEYDIYRLVGLHDQEPGQVIKNFPNVWSPRVGLVYKISQEVAFHGSFGTGFSPPTVKEIRTSDGVLNLDLEPEHGTNYEFGFRGTALNRRLNFDITTFTFQLNETIVTYTDEIFATQKFRNAGSTSQKGLEIMGGFYLLRGSEGLLNSVRLNGSYARHHFRFRNYVRQEQDYSGNKLTGVAPNVATGSLDVKAAAGFYGFFTYHFTDKIPLNDANTFFAPSYQLVDMKLGWEGTINRVGWDIHGGINNALNEIYSLGNDLNPFGGRYFQPAAERNFYFGARMAYRI